MAKKSGKKPSRKLPVTKQAKKFKAASALLAKRKKRAKGVAKR